METLPRPLYLLPEPSCVRFSSGRPPTAFPFLLLTEPSTPRRCVDTPIVCRLGKSPNTAGLRFLKIFPAPESRHLDLCRQGIACSASETSRSILPVLRSSSNLWLKSRQYRRRRIFVLATNQPLQLFPVSYRPPSMLPFVE